MNPTMSNAPEQAQNDPRQTYTLLRIKRKRNEEPLDALVVDSGARRKKSKNNLNVFQFAETVEKGVWDDERKKKDIEARITSLAREISKKEIRPSISEPVVPAPAQAPPRRQQALDTGRSYTVVQNDVLPESTRQRASTAPPRVITREEYDRQQQPSVTVYDAIPSEAAGSAQQMEVDQEMDKFIPMLQEYLKVNNIETSAPTPPTASQVQGKDDDYVWDVFYQRPTTFQELYQPNVIVAKLTGLPSDGEFYDSDTDSEVSDEADEDSNAEDWYANDYPDEEAPQTSEEEEESDEFHEASDHEEIRYRDIGDYKWSKEHTA